MRSSLAFCNSHMVLEPAPPSCLKMSLANSHCLSMHFAATCDHRFATYLCLVVVQVFDQNRTGTATPMQSPTDTQMTTPGSVANEAVREAPGCGLGLNVDVMVCRAEWYYHVGAYQVSVHVPYGIAALLSLTCLQISAQTSPW